MRARSRYVLSMLAFGYAFLYIPLLSVIFYSFNNSALATVWGGFSTRWYAQLMQNEQVLDAALLSLKIAITSATLATIFGTLAGIALTRAPTTGFSAILTKSEAFPYIVVALRCAVPFHEYRVFPEKVFPASMQAPEILYI